MKLMKWIVPLAVVVLLLVTSLSAAAQVPCAVAPCVHAATFNGTAYVVTAGTNEDPFGGLPRPGSGGVPGAVGIAGKYGWSSTVALPGGVPSERSGDGTSPRKAINISGAWDPARSYTGEVPFEVPTCVTIKSPAGTSRWFKAATWRNRQLMAWIDDELNDATKPSGAAVFGAADAYMWGTAPGDAWETNAFNSPSWDIGQTGYNRLTGPFLAGYVMAIYDPNALQPNYLHNPPNAFILTLNTSATGSIRRSGPYGNGVSLGSVGGGPHGYGQFNFGEPQHLVWYDGRFDGWAFIRVYNQMIWDGVITVCTYRHVIGLR